jgi:hypothetical protein
LKHRAKSVIALIHVMPQGTPCVDTTVALGGTAAKVWSRAYQLQDVFLGEAQKPSSSRRSSMHRRSLRLCGVLVVMKMMVVQCGDRCTGCSNPDWECSEFSGIDSARRSPWSETCTRVERC